MKDVITINMNIYCDKLLACGQGSLVNLQSCDCLYLCGAVWCCVVLCGAVWFLGGRRCFLGRLRHFVQVLQLLASVVETSCNRCVTLSYKNTCLLRHLLVSPPPNTGNHQTCVLEMCDMSHFYRLQMSVFHDNSQVSPVWL